MYRRPNEEQWRSSFIFAELLEWHLELHFIFCETTFAHFIDAVPITMAAYKTLCTNLCTCIYEYNIT